VYILYFANVSCIICVKQLIQFNIATLTYHTLQSGSPSYLSSLINFNNPSRPLRSSSLNLIHVPFTAKSTQRKAFQSASPTVWNFIPQNIRLLPSTGSFKRSLKTFIVQSCSPPRYNSAFDSSLLKFVHSIDIVSIIMIIIIISLITFWTSSHFS